MEECKRCKYWVAAVATSTGKLYGQCRRHPPEVAQEGLADRNKDSDQKVMLIGEWLYTESTDFCGEFVHKPRTPQPSKN